MRRSSLSPLLLAALVVAPALTAQAPAGRSITVQAMLERPTYGAYRIAPDGERILFTRTDRDPKDWAATSHVWLHERASGRSFQLTNSPRGEANPQFLPDGRVTFTSNRDGRNAWYVIDPRGGEATLLVEGGDSLPSGGSFSRDGTKLVFTQQTERPDKKEWDERVRKRDDGYYAEQKLTWTHVWLYDLTAKKKTQLTSGETDNTGPAISPDNRLVAFSSNRTGRGCVMPTGPTTATSTWWMRPAARRGSSPPTPAPTTAPCSRRTVAGSPTAAASTSTTTPTSWT
jgi:Tol biopolymer transport system component